MSRDEIMARLARRLDWMSPAQARAGMCCVRCGDGIDDDWTTADLKEWEISLLCGQCFDAVAEPE